MTDRAMPAATSHEDIYQISSSFCSSSYPSSSASSAASSPSFSHLPGYMMFMDGQLNGSQQRFNPLKGDSSSSSSSSGGSSKTITCQQQHQRHRHLSSNQQHNQKFHQLYQKHIQAAASPSRQQVVAKQSKSHHISYQWLAQPYSLMAAYDEQANSLAGLVEPVMVFCDDDANYNDQINKKQLSNSYTATYNSETDLISSDGDNCFSLSMTPPTQHYLTIEELRLARNSCWLCGCNWQQDHVSLDCSECGGYSLTRPCPSCDGDCKQIWERNINETHDNHKATWVGRCNKLLSSDEQQASKSTSISNDHNQLNVPPMASSCCSSQPSSAASSDSESDCQQATISKPTTEQQQSHRPTTSALCICN